MMVSQKHRTSLTHSGNMASRDHTRLLERVFPGEDKTIHLGILRSENLVLGMGLG